MFRTSRGSVRTAKAYITLEQSDIKLRPWRDCGYAQDNLYNSLICSPLC